MAHAKCSEKDFVELFEANGAAITARKLGVAVRDVYKRRARLETKLKRQITGPTPTQPGAVRTRQDIAHPQRLLFEIDNGTVIVGSDAHYWPHIKTTAHRAMVHFVKKFQPGIVVMNGDALDGASISRFPRIGWEEVPTLEEEIQVTRDRLLELEEAAPNAIRVWSLGNHDGRFETRLATVAPEFAKVHGFSLRDHFPDWQPCWSAWINSEVVIKHRFKGGVHATHQNTVNAGKTMVTGHLHSLKVTPFNDYNGCRWGVDTGTLADVFGPQFMNYREDNISNWRSGFAVLTFKERRLMWPEVVHVVDENRVEFRGEFVEV